MKLYPLSATDSYKLSHAGFGSSDPEINYSNLTPRTSKYMPLSDRFYDGKTVFFGLQYFIKDFLIDEWNAGFFDKEKAEVIKRFKRRCDTYLGPDTVDMKKFEDLHDLGHLPIEIKALPEGSVIPMKVPFLTIQNTNPEFSWLTNYLETVLSCELWSPTYTATLTRAYRKMIESYADQTVGNRDHCIFQLHGFEFRGMRGRKDAALSGAAFLLNSCGTDTIPAIDLLEDYYGADAEKELIGASVPASEHAITSLGTSTMGELEFYRKALTECFPEGIVSLVWDTYDYFKGITDFLPQLKDVIENRKENAIGLKKTVIRPDSGNPLHIICGDPNAPEGSPERKGTVQLLWEIFGGSTNNLEYKELNPCIGVIYGDGMKEDLIFDILQTLKEQGFASNNIVFGVGSWSMLGGSSRDSLGIAQKATWAQVDGIGHNLFKDPKTDDGMKKSAKGLLRVDIVDGEYILRDQCTKEEEAGGELQTVFKNGKLLKETTLSEIRERIRSYDK